MSAYPPRGREGLLGAIREQLREATSEVLASALERLERGDQEGHTGPSAGGHDALERTREILERDRALRDAAPNEGPATGACTHSNPVRLPSPEEAERSCQEPIRTRTMAKLLACQGETERALSIYMYLLTHGSPDPGLEGEIEALRSAAREERAPTLGSSGTTGCR